MKAQFLGAATLIAPALIVAACSSSSKTAGQPAGSQPGTAVVTSSAPAHTTQSHSTPADGGRSASAVAWCQELKAAGEGIIAVGGTSTASPDAYKAKLESLVSDAPADIRPDLQAVADIDEKLADGDANADNAIANPAVAQKFQHVVRWLSTNCRGVLRDLPTTLPG
jgi:hypothetical protein